MLSVASQGWLRWDIARSYAEHPHPPPVIPASSYPGCAACSLPWVQLFPATPSHKLPAPCQELSWGLPFVLKHLAGRNPAAMQFHCLHAKSINELISKVK